MTEQKIDHEKGSPIDPYADEDNKREADKLIEDSKKNEESSKEAKAEKIEKAKKAEELRQAENINLDITKAPEADTSESKKINKNEDILLQEITPNLHNILIGLGWDAPEKTGSGDKDDDDDGDAEFFDLDASAFLLSHEGRVRFDSDFVFYNNAETEGGAIRHHGDNRDGVGDGDDEMISVSLDEIAVQVTSIIFVVTIHEAYERLQHFGMVENAYIRIVDLDTNKELLRYSLTEDADKKDAIVLGELIRDVMGWKFHAIGETSVGGLYEIAKGYGVYVAPT